MKRYYTYLLFASLLIFYICFWARTYSGDAWAFAGALNWGRDLFEPHHLLYTASGYLLKRIFVLFPGERWFAINTLLIMDSLGAWLGMLILYLILLLLNKDKGRSLLLTALAAFSFAYWRYATNIEVYILPILFSLVSTFYFVKYIRLQPKPIFIFLSGLAGAIACLYHQLHIIWWLGLLMGGVVVAGKKKQFLLFYTLPFLIVPLTYFSVIYFYTHQALTFYNIIHFVLHDFYSGEAGVPLGFNHIKLGLINLGRTFFQVNGIVGLLLGKYPWLWLAPILSASLLIYFICKVINNYKKFSYIDKSLFRIFFGILTSQWLFAVYNVGNAEFMVMLPALLVLMLAFIPAIPGRAIISLVCALFIWNFTFGILPARFFRADADRAVGDFMWNTQTFTDEPKNIYLVATNKAMIENYLNYLNLEPQYNLLSPPAMYAFRHSNSAMGLKAKIDSCINKGAIVLTDCTSRPVIASRAAMLYYAQDTVFFNQYKLEPFIYRNKPLSFPTDAGPHSLQRVFLR